MADYALMAAQEEQKRRSGRSFFPAAQRTTLGNTPSRMLTNYSSFQNNVQIPTGGYQALSPDQNPAYQSAIAGGRPLRTGFTTIPTPSKGTMSVPAGQADKYASLLARSNIGAATPSLANLAPNENMFPSPVGTTATQRTNYASRFPAVSKTINTGVQPNGIPTTPIPAIPNATPQPAPGGATPSPGVQPNSALAAVQSFQQTGKFNLQPLPPLQPLPKPRSYGEMGVY